MKMKVFVKKYGYVYNLDEAMESDRVRQFYFLNKNGEKSNWSEDFQNMRLAELAARIETDGEAHFTVYYNPCTIFYIRRVEDSLWYYAGRYFYRSVEYLLSDKNLDVTVK